MLRCLGRSEADSSDNRVVCISSAACLALGELRGSVGICRRQPAHCLRRNRSDNMQQQEQNLRKRGTEMTFDTREVARRIRGRRIAKNMTQMQLADEMGVSYQAVSNWERGVSHS